MSIDSVIENNTNMNIEENTLDIYHKLCTSEIRNTLSLSSHKSLTAYYSHNLPLKDIIKINMGLVFDVIGKYKYSSHQNVDDLIAVGTLALVEAAKVFYAEKHDNFAAYLAEKIKIVVDEYSQGNIKDANVSDVLFVDETGTKYTFEDFFGSKGNYAKKAASFKKLQRALKDNLGQPDKTVNTMEFEDISEIDNNKDKIDMLVENIRSNPNHGIFKLAQKVGLNIESKNGELTEEYPIRLILESIDELYPVQRTVIEIIYGLNGSKQAKPKEAANSLSVDIHSIYSARNAAIEIIKKSVNRKQNPYAGLVELAQELGLDIDSEDVIQNNMIHELLESVDELVPDQKRSVAAYFGLYDCGLQGVKETLKSAKKDIPNIYTVTHWGVNNLKKIFERKSDPDAGLIKLAQKVGLEIAKEENEERCSQLLLLAQCVEELGPRQRQVIEVLYGLNGNKQLTFKEAEEILKISSDNLYSSEYRGISNLKKSIKKKSDSTRGLLELAEKIGLNIDPDNKANDNANIELLINNINELEERQKEAIIAYFELKDKFQLKNPEKLPKASDPKIQAHVQFGMINLKKKINQLNNPNAGLIELAEKVGLSLPDDLAEIEKNDQIILLLDSVKELSTSKRQITEAVYGLNGNKRMTYKEVEDILGISNAHTYGSVAINRLKDMVKYKNNLNSALLKLGEGIGLDTTSQEKKQFLLECLDYLNKDYRLKFEIQYEVIREKDLNLKAIDKINSINKKDVIAEIRDIIEKRNNPKLGLFELIKDLGWHFANEANLENSEKFKVILKSIGELDELERRVLVESYLFKISEKAFNENKDTTKTINDNASNISVRKVLTNLKRIIMNNEPLFGLLELSRLVGLNIAIEEFDVENNEQIKALLEYVKELSSQRRLAIEAAFGLNNKIMSNEEIGKILKLNANMAILYKCRGIENLKQAVKRNSIYAGLIELARELELEVPSDHEELEKDNKVILLLESISKLTSKQRFAIEAFYGLNADKRLNYVQIAKIMNISRRGAQGHKEGGINNLRILIGNQGKRVSNLLELSKELGINLIVAEGKIEQNSDYMLLVNSINELSARQKHTITDFLGLYSGNPINLKKIAKAEGVSYSSICIAKVKAVRNLKIIIERKKSSNEGIFELARRMGINTKDINDAECINILFSCFDSLSSKEKHEIEMIYGLNNNKPINRIEFAKIIGISHQAVYMHERNTIEKLRRLYELKTNQLKGFLSLADKLDICLEKQYKENNRDELFKLIGDSIDKLDGKQRTLINYYFGISVDKSIKLQEFEIEHDNLELALEYAITNLRQNVLLEINKKGLLKIAEKLELRSNAQYKDISQLEIVKLLMNKVNKLKSEQQLLVLEALYGLNGKESMALKDTAASIGLKPTYVFQLEEDAINLLKQDLGVSEQKTNKYSDITLTEEQWQMVTDNERLIGYVVSKVLKLENHYLNDELMEVGFNGLIKAAALFDKNRENKFENKKVKFSSFAVTVIRNEILVFLRKEDKHSRVKSFNDTLTTDKDGNARTLEEIIGTESDLIENEVFSNLDYDNLMSSLSKLKPQLKEVLVRRFGLLDGERKTQQEVGDELGISRTHVNRLEKVGLTKLRELMEKEA